MNPETRKNNNKIDLPGFKYEYTLINLADLPHELFLASKEPEEQILAVLANTGATFKKEGLAIDFIARTTKLSIQEIESL